MVKESDLGNSDFHENYFYTKGTPLRRWGTPEEIAQKNIVFDIYESSYVNGTILVADDGITIA